MTKQQLEHLNDRLTAAFQEIVSGWEISRDIRDAIERARAVVAELNRAAWPSKVIA